MATKVRLYKKGDCTFVDGNVYRVTINHDAANQALGRLEIISSDQAFDTKVRDYADVMQEDGITPIGTTSTEVEDYLSITVSNFKTATGGSVALVNAFRDRVLADTGTFEGYDYLKTWSKDNYSLIKNASLVLTPNGYKNSKLFALVPSDGTGDLTLTRGSGSTRTNPSFLIENLGINIPSIDYGSGEGAIRMNPQRTNEVIDSVISGATITAPWQENGTGTFEVIASTLTNIAQAVRITKVAEAGAIISNAIFFVNGQTYCLSIIVEAITGTAHSLDDFCRITGPYTGSLVYRVNGAVVAGSDVVEVGLIEVLFSCTADSTNGIAWGATGLGAPTNVITMSMPMVEIANYRGTFIPTTASGIVTRIGDSNNNTILGGIGTMPTIEFRAREFYNEPIGNNWFLTTYVDDNNFVGFFVNSSSIMLVFVKIAGVVEAFPTGAFDTTVFHDFKFEAFDTNKFRLYIDGVLEIGDTAVSGNFPNMDKYSISYIGNSGTFAGELDNLIIT